MSRTLIVYICFAIRIASADDGGSMPTDGERFLAAIARGDLASVRQTAGSIRIEQVPNLLSHALSSPNPDVVAYLRQSHDLGISDLQIAAIRGDTGRIRQLLGQLDGKAKRTALAQGYASPISSQSPLSLAVRNGHADAVRELISADAEVNEYCHYTLTPLANAAELGHTEIVRLLLNHGAVVDMAPDSYTALMRACVGGKFDSAKILLDAGANPNAVRQDGQRPLHFAAKAGSVECVNLLLARGESSCSCILKRHGPEIRREQYNHQAIVKVLQDAVDK
ncbi:MAG: ankyrin repeat domain-containing protein [Pirellulaceae bacterium]